ncbi:MAG: phage tail tape measure protein [Candidatus Thorarchaeota archaeon]|nr:MAG: phage tail tape measure protein [Candidatus Thorarchaeota archaeon]
MATAQNKVNAEIILKLDKLQTQMTSVSNMAMRTNANMANSAQKAAKSTSAAWLAGFAIISVYAVKMANSVIGAFKGMVDTYAGFEQSLANTQSVARANSEELLRLEEAARRVGATTRSTASDAANALYYLASAGFSATEAIGALDGVNALAIATNSDLARTTEVVATTIRQYNLETGQATDIANTFTAAITNSLATMDKLAKSFEYVGPIAAGLGISVEETTGALQLLYNKGFSGEKAGRGLRSILVDLADSTSVVNKKLRELNISFDQVNPATNELADIFDTLRENGVNATNAAAIFGKVSGVQLASLISVASDAEGGMIELTDAVTDTNRAFESMAIQMDTLQGSIDKFKNAEEALAITIGKELDPVLTAIVDIFTGMVKGINKLNPALLAVVSTITTIGAVSVVAAVGVTLFNAALVAANTTFAAAAGALLSIAAPIALVIGGIVALTAATVKLNKMTLERYKDQFGGIAESTGVADEELKKFLKSSGALNSELNLIASHSRVHTRSVEALGKMMDRLADKYGLTREQELLLMHQNEALDKVAKDGVVRLSEQMEQEKAYNELRLAGLRAQAAPYNEYLQARKADLAISKAKAEEEAKQKKESEQQAESLERAFTRATELQKAFGDEFDRNAYLTNAFNESIKKLIDEGLTWEDQKVQDQIKLYERLQEATEKVGEAGLTYRQKNIIAQDKLKASLREIADLEKFNAEQGIEYDANAARSAAVVSTIHGMLKDGFTYEGGAIQQVLELYGDLISEGESVNGILDEYLAKLVQLDASKTELLEIQKQSAILQAEEKDATENDLKAIEAYYDALRDKELESQFAALDMSDKLKELTMSEIELIDAERGRAKASVRASDLSEDSMTTLETTIDRYFDKLKEDQAYKEFVENMHETRDKVIEYIDAINDLVSASVDYQIEQEERLLDKRLENIDIAEEAALIAAGLQEKTALELAQDKIDAAVLAGDSVAEQEARDAYRRLEIQEEFDQQREDLTDTTNKKIAELNYKADMVAWAADSIAALSKSALAIIEGLATGGAAGGVAMGVLTAAQLATIALSMPQPPKFADGGVVPGSSYKGDTTPILANAGELILNKAQQSNVASKLDNDRPIYITTQVVLDSKIVATSSAKHYRNGTVKL